MRCCRSVRRLFFTVLVCAITSASQLSSARAQPKHEALPITRAHPQCPSPFNDLNDIHQECSVDPVTIDGGADQHATLVSAPHVPMVLPATSADTNPPNDLSHSPCASNVDLTRIPLPLTLTSRTVPLPLPSISAMPPRPVRIPSWPPNSQPTLALGLDNPFTPVAPAAAGTIRDEEPGLGATVLSDGSSNAFPGLGSSSAHPPPVQVHGSYINWSDSDFATPLPASNRDLLARTPTPPQPSFPGVFDLYLESLRTLPLSDPSLPFLDSTPQQSSLPLPSWLSQQPLPFSSFPLSAGSTFPLLPDSSSQSLSMPLPSSPPPCSSSPSSQPPVHSPITTSSNWHPRARSAASPAVRPCSKRRRPTGGHTVRPFNPEATELLCLEPYHFLSSLSRPPHQDRVVFVSYHDEGPILSTNDPRVLEAVRCGERFFAVFLGRGDEAADWFSAEARIRDNVAEIHLPGRIKKALVCRAPALVNQLFLLVVVFGAMRLEFPMQSRAYDKSKNKSGNQRNDDSNKSNKKRQKRNGGAGA